MKTTLDIVEEIWQFLEGSSLKLAISGTVCKKRPLDSQLEDVVVNATFVTGEQMQQGLVNVNIYVPNQLQSFQGKQDATQPDSARLQLLAGQAVALLQEQWSQDYNFSVQQVVGPIEDEGQHYVNIRLNYFSINSLN